MEYDLTLQQISDDLQQDLEEETSEELPLLDAQKEDVEEHAPPAFSQNPADDPQITHWQQPVLGEKSSLSLVSVPAPVIQNKSEMWKFGLCDCCDDSESCCITCFGPCITAGEIWEKGLDKSFVPGCFLWALVFWIPIVVCIILYFVTGIHASFSGHIILAFLYPLLWTGPLRDKLGIKGSYCGDFCSYFWCQCCQMTRERREVMWNWNNDREINEDPVSIESAPMAMI